MTKKVLIIPSWYPSNDNFLVGSFFQEQAFLMHHSGFDIKVLNGKIIKVKRVNFVLQTIKNLFVPKKINLNKKFLLQNPEAFSFPIVQSIRGTEEENMNIICKAYLLAFLELKEQGWLPELIHAQCSADAGIIANYLSKKLEIPYVLIEHQVFLLGQYSKFKQELIKNSFINATRVGAVSNHQVRCILMHGINCKIDIVPNFVDENKFKIELQNKSEKFRIITITYPDLIKDIETFFKSVASFSEMCPEIFEVVIIGNNSFNNLADANTAIFNNLAKKFNIESKCILIPYVSRDDINSYLTTADVFVSTSIAETFGVAVREAMLCGLPVIATKSGGVEDSINEITGIKVNIGDYTAIANSLLKIKNKEFKYNPQQIRNFVISQCGSEYFLNKMNSFYN
ncbi:hypothetical protein DNC80_02285 [Flavobacterium sp. SOK18b]|uniref:glycosyltransferase family 4 protein n=1 Tax=Flavobacterium sp. SOK18b TaxID=797900 RepID=UPI0015FA7188|nr:glycosyltransferase family 4 protein [Flavobacterium sp. SOK18b]MBB1192495.1 hypothetical protein [Flavobacterium sp. SOK18b]